MTNDLKNQVEILASIISLGLAVALENNAISIEESEHLFFSPHTFEVLDALNVEQEIIDLVHCGTELEDIESIVPDELPNSISEIKNIALRLLKKRSTYNLTQRKWFTKDIFY